MRVIKVCVATSMKEAVSHSRALSPADYLLYRHQFLKKAFNYNVMNIGLDRR